MFIRGAGEMAHWLRDFVAVAQDPGPVPSTDVEAYKSPRGSDILFRPPWTLDAHDAYTDMGKHS